MSASPAMPSRVSPEIVDAETSTIMPTYSRLPVHLVRGDGAHLWDEAGNEYIDFMSGIAVVSVGHSRAEISAAVAAQMNELVHVTNLFYTEPQLDLAEELRKLAGWGKVFFSNSGSEANECAIKLARLHQRESGGARGNDGHLVCLRGSFHGRTLGSLSITAQPAKQAPFEPLLPGVVVVDPNDAEALYEAAADAAAVFVEVIQGEAGVRPVPDEFLLTARRACDETGALLVVDEIQTGLCRTGSWLAFQSHGIEPDVYTLGKALGNGLPIAATVARSNVADLFSPGDHGTTMGGGPVVCSAALAVLEIMRSEGLDQAALSSGELLKTLIRDLRGVSEVRGEGLLLAAELDVSPSRVASAAMSKGLLVNVVSPTALRLAPPLVISDDELKRAAEILGSAIEEAGK